MRYLSFFLALILLILACTNSTADQYSYHRQSDGLFFVSQGPDSIGSNPNIKVYFNDPYVFNGPKRSTQSDIGRALIDLINEAESTIDFAIYGFSSQPEVLRALEEALERGVEIRGVVDMDIHHKNLYKNTDDLIKTIKNIRTDYTTDLMSNTMTSLEPFKAYWPNPEGFEGKPQMVGYSLSDDEAIIAVHAGLTPTSFQGDIMHNKFFIVDDRHVWTGSTNLSATGTGGYNSNIACIITSDPLAEIYRAEFNQMYEEGLFHRQKKPSSQQQAVELEDGTKIQVLFSPQDDVIPSAILPLIQSATSTIHLPGFYLTDKNITGELIKAHNRGVAVKVIIDARAAQSGYTKHEILRAAGIPVKVENWGGKMHMKSLTVDAQQVVIGSMNFTASGTNRHDENTLIIDNAFYATEADRFFNYLWDAIPDRYLYENPHPESLDSLYSLRDGLDNDSDGLIDWLDNINPPNTPLPPYTIVKKTEEANLIKGIENGSGRLVYLLPNSDHYKNFWVNKSYESYFPSIEEAVAAGFTAFVEEQVRP